MAGSTRPASAAPAGSVFSGSQGRPCTWSPRPSLSDHDAATKSSGTCRSLRTVHVFGKAGLQTHLGPHQPRGYKLTTADALRGSETRTKHADAGSPISPQPRPATHGLRGGNGGAVPDGELTGYTYEKHS